MPTVVLTREQVREVDSRAIQDYSMAGVVLMENAGRGCAELLTQQGVSGTVAILAGKGNNAGDGFVIARHLENAGIPVKVLLLSAPEDLRGDALANYRILNAAETPVVLIDQPEQPESYSRHLQDAEWIVDALLGTGMRGNVRAPFDTAIEAINRHPARVLAVDIPSGMDCDTGGPLGCCVRADLTATFVALKPCFQADRGKELAGAVHVVDIGVPRRLIRELAG